MKLISYGVGTLSFDADALNHASTGMGISGAFNMA